MVGVREGTSDLWVLVAGVGTVRLEAYPQDAMGVPSLPSTHATLASAIGSPQDFVWDSTWYWVLDNDDKIIYAIDTSFNRESSEDIDITARTNNPITIAWTGHQLVVFDRGTSQNKLFFGEAPAPPVPAPQPQQQFRRLNRFVQKFDIAKVGTVGELTLRGVALEGILETTARLVNTGSSVDLETQLNAVTLYL